MFGKESQTGGHPPSEGWMWPMLWYHELLSLFTVISVFWGALRRILLLRLVIPWDVLWQVPVAGGWNSISFKVPSRDSMSSLSVCTHCNELLSMNCNTHPLFLLCFPVLPSRSSIDQEHQCSHCSRTEMDLLPAKVTPVLCGIMEWRSFVFFQYCPLAYQWL